MDSPSPLQPKFKKPAPYDRANFLLKAIVGYPAPTFIRGWRKGVIQVEDLYQSPKNDVVEKITRPLVRNWELQLQKRNNKGKPSFMLALARTFALCYLPPLLIYLFTEVALRVATPLLLGKVIRYFSGDREISYRDAWIYAGSLCLCTFLQLTINHPTMLHLKRLGMRLRVSCSAMLYQKSLKLSRAALGQTSVAQTVNIMSNDCNRFDEFSIWVPYIIIAPVHTIVSVYFVYKYIGVASFAGIAFLIGVIPYQSFMGRCFSTVRFKIAGLTDNRLRYLNEVISAIHVVKMYCWEQPFADKIAQARKAEVAQVQKACYLKAVNSSTFFVASKAVLFVCFLVYVLMGNVLNPEGVFVCLSLLNALQNTVTKYLPLAVGTGAEVLISCQRIEKFLLLEETSSNWETTLKQNPKMKDMQKYRLPKMYADKPSLTVNNITARWNADLPQPTLQDISADLKSGDLLAVIGPVGSGKSSFLMALLKELPLESGHITMQGSLSYASQEAWTYSNDSLRNNVLFNLPYDETRYRKVIDVCALKRDLKLLPNGDRTLVGERGVQLSGGQKARVNLARAVYRDAEILLADDPLSAVDANVAEQIFEKCIVKHLHDKIRVLVTHQIQFIEKATKILILKEGQCLAYGTFEQLQKKGIDFMSLLAKQEEAESAPSQQSIYESTNSVNSTSSDTSELDDTQNVIQVKEELAQQGSLDAVVYGKYIKSSGAPLLWLVMILFTVTSQTLFHGTDLFLTQWTNKNQGINGTATVDEAEQYRDIYIYTGLIASLFITTIIRSFSFFNLCMRSAQRLHDETFARLLRAPVAFFDSVPAGRILNRLAKDMGIIDELIPITAFDLNLILGNAIGVVVTVSIVNWYLVIPALVIFAIVVYLRSIYIISARDIKRIEGLTRSPIYSLVNNSIIGLTSIRAYNAQDAFERQFYQYLDDHSGIWYHYLSFSKFIGIIIDWIVVSYITMITVSVMLTPEIAGGYAGLAISSGLLLAGITQYGVRQSTEFETQMTSVERILEYQQLEMEAPVKTDAKLHPHWPAEGAIEFDRVNLEYITGKPVLRDLTFKIKGGEKIGLVGRTGSGKSSCITALFRLKEPTGWILIDSVETQTIGLADLRKQISIIPQDPVIFSGTVRYNLDPFSEHSDEQIWSALDKVQLKNHVNAYPGKLNAKLADSGSNLSVGQRQLICLARAIIRRNRILVMDEATSNVDNQTDSLIQNTIRSEFASCTVLTIAHRLNTIIDCDRVLVLDAGEILEFDSPYKLLEQKGAFYQMCKKTGPSMFQHLHNLAKETHFKRNQTIAEIKKAQDGID